MTRESCFPLVNSLSVTDQVSFAGSNDVVVMESGLQWAVTYIFVFVLRIMPLLLLLNVFQVYYISRILTV